MDKKKLLIISAIVLILLLTAIGVYLVKFSAGDQEPTFTDGTENSSLVQKTPIATTQKVDLGLSVYWAGYNVGATYPDDFGGFYAFGETREKRFYTVENSETEKMEIGDISGSKRYDVACVEWGEPWRIPTKSEWEELLLKCKLVWTTYNGMKGCKVIGPNGNAMFLPAVGYKKGGLHSGVYSHGDYRSSTPVTVSSFLGVYAIAFLSNLCIPQDIGYDRYTGLPVRPVCSKGEVKQQK